MTLQTPFPGLNSWQVVSIVGSHMLTLPDVLLVVLQREPDPGSLSLARNPSFFKLVKDAGKVATVENLLAVLGFPDNL